MCLHHSLFLPSLSSLTSLPLHWNNHRVPVPQVTVKCQLSNHKKSLQSYKPPVLYRVFFSFLFFTQWQRSNLNKEFFLCFSENTWKRFCTSRGVSMKTCWQKNQEALKENVSVSLESFHSAEVYCSLKVSHYRWHFSSPLLNLLDNWSSWYVGLRGCPFIYKTE